MASGLSASTVKSWFQYRCERKTRYDMMSRAERDSATIVKEESGAAWALEGNKFEERVLARLQEKEPLLRPGPNEDRLGQAETIAFLRGQTKQKAATQLGLEQGPSFRAALGLPDGLQINRSYTDIVFRETTPEGARFRIVDIKATRSSTPFHKAQVAFYALLLRGMLADLGIDASVDATGAVWHIRAGSRVAEGLVEPATFPLKPYLRLVEEFLKRDAPRIAKRKVLANVDETFFHIYFKCEQCDYLAHCRKAIGHPNPADNDVSAVPGVSHEGKLALQARGLKTVGLLAGSAGIGATGPTSWSLQRRSDTIIARAGAITANEVRRLPDVMSYLMPPRIERAFYLLADHDAVEDNLVTIAYMRRGGTPRSVIRVIDKSSPDTERQAMLDVFTALIADLGEVDAHNAAADPDQQLQAHIFIYEPAEARAIQAAIGRHLDDPQIRTGLLHAVRLFPPEDVVPEPEFKGAHHLPATAIRSVIEQLYALPTMVSYDLRQVSEALHTAGQIDAAYAPVGTFRRDFSSLLAMEAIRSLREGLRDGVTVAQVEADVRARLETAARLVEWLTSQNATAQPPFLRLEKQPFRFQSTLNPLNAGDLDLLHAYELLDSRSALLETLVRLAQPARVRQQRGECLAGLTLESEGRHSNGCRWLRFSIPAESRDAEISPDDIGLILTDDNPDLRLNPANWRPLEIRFSYGDHGSLFVNMSARQYDSAIMASLRRQTGPKGWCIDKTHRDVNGPRVQDFLLQLGGQP
ncbi:PD-(D/E)XK nuclease family protein [Sphingomonas sp. IC-56]|uniref:PD-(D/E)XK nuclease family protein n=1 Tax=Sphingomonas sp. IC-56 TaxID=2898529 RepID=UPI001E427A7F|nr:PD-(D/E)XK nuclease family protein [Sphingomonas sp. IC-56]MCD2323462.1 PD-(D/E)XK nuclease family protein [Sphingomonas sp. IC-56]